MKNDVARAITIEQLKQQYRLDTKELLKAIELERANLNKIENEFNNYIDAVTKGLENLQDQVDGNITTWFFSGVPTLNNYPANEWIIDEDKNKHLGDLYYNQDTGYAYRFSCSNNEYNWLKLTDSDITEALALANAAKDTADSKRRVFVNQPSPPYDNGDLWIKNNEIYICQISKSEGLFNNDDFINNLKYTDDTKATEVDGKLKVLSGKVTIIEAGVDEINQKVEENKYFVDSAGNEQLISSSMTQLTQDVSGLQVEVNNFDTQLGENYYTKENINTMILNSETGLSNIFTNSGGNNLLRNTAPWFMTSDNVGEFWNGNIKQVEESNSTSGYAILTQQGTASQSISLANGDYSLSFRYKKLIDGAECSVSYNGRTFDLTDNEGEIHSSGEITNGQFIIEIIANSNNGFEIYDLMLKHGVEGAENMLVWIQNANESRSDTVQISQGITATSTTTDTKATMDSEGFKVRNKTTSLSVMEATATGGLFYDLTSTHNSNISGLLVKKAGNLIKINGESGS